jgi:hypothetical protein
MTLPHARPHFSKQELALVYADKDRAAEAMRESSWWKGIGVGTSDSGQLQLVFLVSPQGKNAAVKAIASLNLESPWTVSLRAPVIVPQPYHLDSQPDLALRARLRTAFAQPKL